MGQALTTAFTLTRESNFAYTCRQCNRCCYEKRIPLNPYEVIRLAKAARVSTGEFLTRYTEEGTALAVRDRPGQPCVFLGEKGCTVHAGRPAACRLYPLGRLVTSSGEEIFCRVELHPLTEGLYRESGTVAEFLAHQEVEPYLLAAEHYYALFQRVQAILAELPEGDETTEVGLEPLELLDADTVITAQGHVLPEDPEEKMHLHLAVLNRWLDGLIAVK